MDALTSLIFFLFFSSVFGYDSSVCIQQGKATHFTSPSPLSSGACGYGSLALGLNGGYLASGVPALYRDGVGCGACFHIWCTNKNICSEEGTKIILSDLNKSNDTDFVLSNKAFMEMAQKGKEQQISEIGNVDIQYRRIPCVYEKQNLTIVVDETSQKPDYLAIKFLYQGGQTDILAVSILEVSSKSWFPLWTKYGVVWDSRNAARVPRGDMLLRMVVIGGYDGKMIHARKVLPADWKVGATYDLGVQIDDIAKDACSPPCADNGWN